MKPRSELACAMMLPYKYTQIDSQEFETTPRYLIKLYRLRIEPFVWLSGRALIFTYRLPYLGICNFGPSVI